MSKTISEIAEATGYSRTTVTMVLSGRASEYRISGRAQKLIQAYVEQHGYTINQTARNLKTRRSHTVGFIAPDIANPFFARIMAHLEALCREEGLVLVTTSSLEDPETERRAMKSLLSRGVDGVVLAPCGPQPQETIRKSGKVTPVVLIDRRYCGDRAPIIASDHETAAYHLTRAVSDTGNIAFLCGHPANPSIQERIAGFRRAAAEAGLSGTAARILTDTEDSMAAGAAMMSGLLEDGCPAAIVCSSLLVLEGALQQMKRALGTIPDDLVVATFDYDGLLEFLPNRVFVVQQDEAALARAAFDLLQRQIDGPLEAPAQGATLQARIVSLG